MQYMVSDGIMNYKLMLLNYILFCTLNGDLLLWIENSILE